MDLRSQIYFFLTLVGLGLHCSGVASQDPVGIENLRVVVRDSYLAVHDGWSSDEVLIQDKLNSAFLEACRRDLPEASSKELNWTMLNLRKARKLGGKVTRRSQSRHEPHRHAAEIAARMIEDQHRINIDRALCDPKMRAEFDKQAKRLAPKVEC